MIEFIEIETLNLLEKNPRKITDVQFSKLMKSLQEDPEFLEKRPILVNRKGDDLIVYAGNQRVRAAANLGWKTVPCIIDENLSEARMKSRTIKDNKTYGFFDDDLLFGDYDENLLLDCGFLDIELDGSTSLDIGDDDKKDKKKKDKVCPHCGEAIK